jgi:hypothetical protein
MPIFSRDEIKQWFQTGDTPTEAQFANLLDSLVHKNDTTVDLGSINTAIAILTTLIQTINTSVQNATSVQTGELQLGATDVAINVNTIYAGMLLTSNTGSVVDINITRNGVTTNYLESTSIQANEELVVEQRIFGNATLTFNVVGDISYKLYR